jgi:hypothetical protein
MRKSLRPTCIEPMGQLRGNGLMLYLDDAVEKIEKEDEVEKLWGEAHGCSWHRTPELTSFLI